MIRIEIGIKTGPHYLSTDTLKHSYETVEEAVTFLQGILLSGEYEYIDIQGKESTK